MLDSDYTKEIRRQLLESSRVKKDIAVNCIDSIKKAVVLMIECFSKGRTFFWCGNGGSAAQAQHLSTELVGGLRNHSRSPIPSVSLTTDSSFLTAWSNDVSYKSVFSRQVESLGNTGDVLVALSTSGNSKNVIEAVKLAASMKMNSIIMTGESGGLLSGMGNVVIKIPSNDTQRIQEGHILVGHIICELLEQHVMDNSD